MRCVLPV